MREAELRAELAAACPTSWCASRPSTHDISDVDGLAAIGEVLFGRHVTGLA